MSELQTLPRARGVRQADIARALQVSEGTVSKWLRGHQPIPSRALRPLAAILGVPVEALLPPPHPAQHATPEAA